MKRLHLQELPQAAVILASAAAQRDAPQLSALAMWAPSPLLQAAQLLAGEAGHHPAVRAYALRSLSSSSSPEEVAFFLPQLVQQLRTDEGRLVEAFLLASATRSQLFAHHLICALRVWPNPGP